MATLTLPKAKSDVKDKRTPPERLVGKVVQVQTRSPTQITGKLESFSGGWLVIDGTERRWGSDGSLSDVVSAGRFSLERSTVSFLLEVSHG